MKYFTSLLVLATAAHGFHAGTPPRPSTALHSTPFLHLGTTTEEDAAYLINKAQECALSDDVVSKEDIQFFLRELLHVQSCCVVGTLAGPFLCENQEQIKDIVVGLQHKMEQSSSRRGHSMSGVSIDKNGAAVAHTTEPPVALSLAVLGVVSGLFATIIL